jgi:hypothetical protein
MAIDVLGVGVDEIDQINRRLRIPPEYLVMAALQDLNYPVATWRRGLSGMVMRIEGSSCRRGGIRCRSRVRGVA